MPGIWERAYEDTYKIEISDYPFWLLSSRSMQFAWGANAGIPMIKEVADNIAGHGGVIINTGWAHEIGIADGGQIACQDNQRYMEIPGLKTEMK